MRVAVTGSRGQLGRLVVQALQPNHDVLPLALPDFDLTNPRSIPQIIALHPDLVIHCAAMTDVDGCAREPGMAFRVNALGTRNISLACRSANAAMLYVSTNEVFDGEKETPYLEFDTPHPINVYAKSKLAGESYVQELLEHFYIVRTAWLYARGGGKFPDKIMDCARHNLQLSGVVDEIACPTYAPDLAAAILRLVATEQYGIYHLVNSGCCSRYEWIVEILRHAKLPRPVKPITRDEYHRDSTPPKNGALKNLIAESALGIGLRPWQDALCEFFEGADIQGD